MRDIAVAALGIRDRVLTHLHLCCRTIDPRRSLARTPIGPVADPESFHWVGIQYRNSASQYATVLATVLRYLGRQESGVVLGLPKTRLGPPLLVP
jgi:hypothetical protein